MVQNLNKEEATKILNLKKIITDNWWESLSNKEKSNLYDAYFSLLKQAKCKHSKLNKLHYYDIFIYNCEDCGISFDENEIRSMKINDVLNR